MLLLCLILPTAPRAEETLWTSPGPDGQTSVHLYFFWSEHCPHCLDMRPQVLTLAAQNPWIVLHDLEVTRQPANGDRYIAMAAALGEEAQAVPALLYCGGMEVGWENSQATGAKLLASLQQCRLSGARQTPPPPLHLPGLGDVDPARFSLPVLTVIIAGLDAFNPCAFFVLLFLLSLLVHQRDRGRMLLVGLVFVATSGLMYFAFMATWLNRFLLLGSLPWVTAGAGFLALAIGVINLKDFFAFHSGVSLAIPQAQRADIFQRGRDLLRAGSLWAMLAAAFFLAVAANFYELLCTAGFPMVFTRLLTLQEANPTRHYLYLALYNTVYVLPLFLIVIAFVRTMGARRLGEREGRLLKLLSGLMMLGLGLLLVLAPELLDSIGTAAALIAVTICLTWAAARMTRNP